MSLFNFGGMAKDLGKAWDNWVDQDAKPSLGLAYDMALAVGHGLDKAHTDQLASDWKKFGALHPSSGDTFNDVVQGSIAGPLGLGNLGLGAAGAVTDNVAGGKIPGYLNLGVHYVGRGITAATLSDIGGRGGTSQGWVDAWNASEHISPGQSIASLIATEFGGKDNPTLQDVLDYNKQQGIDPTKQDQWYRYTTGSLDFGANFLDPFVGLGKAAKVAKLKYLVKPLRTQRAIETFVDSNQVNKIVKLANDPAVSKAQLYNTAFSKNLMGPQQSAVLKILAGDEEAQRLALGTFAGMPGDYAALAARNEEAAGKIMDIKTREEWASLKNRQSLDTTHPLALKPEDKARLDTLDNLAIDAANSKYIDADLLKSLQGTLINEASPRVSKAQAFRYAVTQKDISDRPMIFSVAKMAYNTADFMTGKSRVVKHVDLNSDFGHRDLADYLQQAGVHPKVAEDLMGRYGSAPSPAVRAMVVNDAEDAAVTALAYVNKLSKQDTKTLLNTARNGRSAAREQSIQQAKVFASETAAKAVNVARKAKAEELAAGGNIQYIQMLDDDGIVNMVGQRILESQNADIMPLADIAHMRKVLSENSGRFQAAKKLGGNTWEMFADLGDTANTIWKTSVLLRGGWTPRMLSDEVMRQWFLTDSTQSLAYAGRGAYNSMRNMGTYIKNGITAAFPRSQAEEIAMLQSIGAPRTKKAMAEVAGAVGKENAKYSNLEEAFANGELTTNGFMHYMGALGKQGLLPENEAALLAGFSIPGHEAEVSRQMIDHAMGKIGQDAYAQGGWRNSLLAKVQESGATTVDVLGGEAKPFSRRGRAKVKSTVIKRMEDGNFNNEDIYNFISDNLDQLTYAKRELSLVPTKEGIELAIHQPAGVKVTSEADLQKLPIFSLKNVHSSIVEATKTKRTQASDRIKIKSRFKDAPDYDLDSFLMDEILSSKVSANGRDGGGLQNLMAAKNLQNTASLHGSESWKIINPGDPNHPIAIERAANRQFHNDTVSRMIMEGKSEQEVTDFLKSDAARGLRRDMPFMASNLEMWDTSVRAYMDNILPDLEYTNGVTGKVRRLRQDALDGTLNFDRYKQVLDEHDIPLPDVHGQQIEYLTGQSKAKEFFDKTINFAMKNLGTTPSDVFSRNPFADRMYRSHLKVLFDASEGMKGAKIDMEHAMHLQDLARRQALKDVNKWLYNTESMSQLAQKTRYLTAFTGATQDAISAWTRIMADDPSVAVTLNKLWNAPEHAGLIVDGEGNHLQMVDGKEVWFTTDENGKRVEIKPGSDELVGQNRRVLIGLPEGVSKAVFGTKLEWQASVPKDGFNTIFQISPGAGPIVAYAMNEVLLRNPALTKDPDSFASHVINQILPFGANSNRAEVLQSSIIKEALGSFQADESHRQSTRTIAMYQAMMVDWAKGGRHGKMPTLDQAADRAGKMGLLRLMTAAISPLQWQYISPYQAHADAFRALMRADPSTAEMKFLASHGEEYFALTQKVTKSLPGLPASAEGYAFFEKHKDLIAKHPELLGLIMGKEGAGAFNKSVYEAQKLESLTPGGEKLRRQKTPEEFAKDLQASLGWAKYSKLMDSITADVLDRGLRSYTDRGAEDLADARQSFLDHAQTDPELKQWWVDYNTHTPQKMEDQIMGMRDIAMNKDFRGRGDILGLSQYLILREQAKDALHERAQQGGAKTLASQSNADLKSAWDDSVMQLVDTNPQFGDLYHRWLDRDHF